MNSSIILYYGGVFLYRFFFFFGLFSACSVIWSWWNYRSLRKKWKKIEEELEKIQVSEEQIDAEKEANKEELKDEC